MKAKLGWKGSVAPKVSAVAGDDGALKGTSSSSCSLPLLRQPTGKMHSILQYGSFMPRPDGSIWGRFTVAFLLLVTGEELKVKNKRTSASPLHPQEWLLLLPGW